MAGVGFVGSASHTWEAKSTAPDAAFFSACLRSFEKRLLGELGYGLMLTHDTSGEALQPQNRYLYEMESGPRVVADSSATGTIILRYNGPGATQWRPFCGKLIIRQPSNDGGFDEEGI